MADDDKVIDVYAELKIDEVDPVAGCEIRGETCDLRASELFSLEFTACHREGVNVGAVMSSVPLLTATRQTTLQSVG